MTSSINESIKQWLQLDLRIEQQYKELEELRVQRDKLEKNIIEHMNSNGMNKTVVKADKYKLSIATENEYTHLSYTFLEKSLSNILQDNIKAKILCEKVKANRHKAQHIYLKRSINKSIGES